MVSILRFYNIWCRQCRQGTVPCLLFVTNLWLIRRRRVRIEALSDRKEKGEIRAAGAHGCRYRITLPSPRLSWVLRRLPTFSILFTLPRRRELKMLTNPEQRSGRGRMPSLPTKKDTAWCPFLLANNYNFDTKSRKDFLKNIIKYAIF